MGVEYQCSWNWIHLARISLLADEFNFNLIKFFYILTSAVFKLWIGGMLKIKFKTLNLHLKKI